MITDGISMIASKIINHQDAIALLSIDKATFVSLKLEREARVRRMRFEEARRAVSPGITQKYQSYIIEGDAVVFYLWIENNHFARGVITSDRFQIHMYKNISKLSKHFHFIGENSKIPTTFVYILGDSASHAGTDESVMEISAAALDIGGNMCMPTLIYEQSLCLAYK